MTDSSFKAYSIIQITEALSLLKENVWVNICDLLTTVYPTKYNSGRNIGLFSLDTAILLSILVLPKQDNESLGISTYLYIGLSTHQIH